MDVFQEHPEEHPSDMYPLRQQWAARSHWWNIPENKLDVLVSDEELAARRAKWQPREPKITTGYLARYHELVTSGNRGAVLEAPSQKN